MDRMPAYIAFRTSLLGADKYFGVAPPQRARCVEFLLELAQAESAPPGLAPAEERLFPLYCAALQEASALVGSGELDPIELPLIDSVEQDNRGVQGGQAQAPGVLDDGPREDVSQGNELRSESEAGSWVSRGQAVRGSGPKSVRRDAVDAWELVASLAE